MFRRSDADWASALVALALLLILLGAFLLARLGALILRVALTYRHTTPFRIAAAVTLSLLLLVLLTAGHFVLINTLALVSVPLFVLTCKGISLYYDPLLQKERAKGILIDEVLHEDWFTDAA